jgi:hypothetical protein
MFITPNLNLKAWDLESDPYSHDDLVENWLAIDAHDHTPGKGKRIVGQSLEAETLTQRELGPCSVAESELCDDAVTNPKLRAGAVSEAKMADNAVTHRVMADAAVGVDELIDLAVSTNKLQDGAVTEPKLATDSVSTSKLRSSAVIEDKIGPQAVSNSKIKDATIVASDKVADRTITRSKVGTSAIGYVEHGEVPSIYAEMGGQQFIPYNSFQDVHFNSVRYANNVILNTAPPFQGWITFPIPGIYILTVEVAWNGGADPSSRDPGGHIARLWRGSNPYYPVLDDGSYIHNFFSMSIDLAQNEWVRVDVKCNNFIGLQLRAPTMLTATWLSKTV